jgi:hypothetical protein
MQRQNLGGRRHVGGVKTAKDFQLPRILLLMQAKGIVGDVRPKTALER